VSTDVAASGDRSAERRRSEAQVRVFDPPGQLTVERARRAAEAGNLGFDTVIIDSAGRHIDDG
jgi:signal recognition particle GTPase